MIRIAIVLLVSVALGAFAIIRLTKAVGYESQTSVQIEGFVHVAFDRTRTKAAGNEFAGFLDLLFSPERSELSMTFSCTLSEGCIEAVSGFHVWLQDGRTGRRTQWLVEYAPPTASADGVVTSGQVSARIDPAQKRVNDTDIVTASGDRSKIAVTISSELFQRSYADFEYFLRLYLPFEAKDGERVLESGTHYVGERSAFVRPIRDRVDERISLRSDGQDRLIVSHQYLSIESKKQMEIVIFSGLLGLVFSLFFETVLSEGIYLRLRKVLASGSATLPGRPLAMDKEQEQEKSGDGTTG